MQHDGQQAAAVLAGRLRDQLFDPVAETDDVRAVGHDGDLVAQRFGAREDRTEHEPGVLVQVDREQRGDRVGLVEELGDVRSREPGRHEAEGGERGVAATDRGLGGEDAVAGVGRSGLEGGARVGDDDDAARRVDAGVAEGLLVDTALRIGLERRAGLRRDHEHGALEVGRHGRADLCGVGRVEDREGHAGGARDDLGCEGRAAHAGEDDVVDPFGTERLAQRGHLGDERAGDRDGLHPAEALRRLGLGGGSPQISVLGGDARGHQVSDEPRDHLFDGPRGVAAGCDGNRHYLAPSSAALTVSTSSPQETLNLSTPSFSSSATTSS